MKLNDVSNEVLLRELDGIIVHGRRLLARLLACLIEVEKRRLDLENAYSSMFDFCTRKLAMSEDEAVRRLAVARLAARYPVILEHIESGGLHLSAILLLQPHLTSDNHDALLRAAVRKTKRQIEELLAARAPRPDVPDRIEPVLEVALQQTSGRINEQQRADGRAVHENDNRAALSIALSHRVHCQRGVPHEDRAGARDDAASQSEG